MTTSDFLRTLEVSLEQDSGTISGRELLSELGFWDSMAVLVFIAVSDEKLGVTLSAADVAKCTSIPDLLGLLAGRLTD